MHTPRQVKLLSLLYMSRLVNIVGYYGKIWNAIIAIAKRATEPDTKSSVTDDVAKYLG